MPIAAATTAWIANRMITRGLRGASDGDADQTSRHTIPGDDRSAARRTR
jgi:hypothetical protein